MTGRSLALAEDPGTGLAAPAAPLEGYTGRQRAAILLISLGPDRAAGILANLTQREVEVLSAEMAALRHVDPDVADAILGRLCQEATASGGAGHGGPEYTRDVLERLLGPAEAQRVLELVVGRQTPRPFDFLRDTAPEQIVLFLSDESPQTVALVCASLPPDVAAGVLAGLPVERQGEVAARIARMGETNPQVVGEVEAGLRTKLSTVQPQEFSTAGGTDHLAAMINRAGRQTERNVLDAVGQTQPELAEEIRSKLFTFEDIATLADRDLQLVLRDADQKDLALALRGTHEELRERIFANMSSRGAEMLREDLEAGQPQPRAVVEAAQAKLVACVREFEAVGTIRIGGGAEGEEEVLL